MTSHGSPEPTLGNQLIASSSRGDSLVRSSPSPARSRERSDNGAKQQTSKQVEPRVFRKDLDMFYLNSTLNFGIQNTARIGIPVRGRP